MLSQNRTSSFLKPGIAARPRNTERKPILATMPGPDPAWNRHVYDYLPPDGGTLADYRKLMRLAKGRELLLLNGSVGRRQRYRDLVFAILLRLSGNKTPVLIQDATWEPNSDSLARSFPALKPLLPRLARMAIRAFDAPNVRYAVLSTDEVSSFPRVWGVGSERVMFQPFPNTLHGFRDIPTSDGGYLFAGGNSMRDYSLLESALEGTDIPLRAATTWKPSREVPHWQVGPTSHEEFMSLMAGARAVVVPMRECVRSAGQQTYLNAMALGKPVVVTQGPGVSDYVIHGETGIVVPRDAQALRAALLHVMDPSNAGFYARMAQRAREDVLARFNEETYRHGLLRHAGAIIGRPLEPAF
jgi:hypothetical protein